MAELLISLSPTERLKRKVSLLTAENRRMARLITNAKLVADLKKITCPVCSEKVAADRSYADPYRHLLKHLIPGGEGEETT